MTTIEGVVFNQVNTVHRLLSYYIILFYITVFKCDYSIRVVDCYNILIFAIEVGHVHPVKQPCALVSYSNSR